MTPENYQWLVNLVRDRYQYLNLTYEQAEKVYKYEQERDTYSEKHYFSAWEEWDYELTVFNEILNDVQFKDYKTWLNENIKRYEQSLIDQDTEKANEIFYYEEQINFYETQFLPDFFKEGLLTVRITLNLNDKTKVEYLRAEYKRFLNDTKKVILTSHFRHNRTLQPNQLKISLLRHELSYMLPNYIAFKHQMDEPTKAVALFLEAKLGYFSDKFEELLAPKFKELNDFHDTLFKKYYSNTGGWTIIIERSTDEEEMQHRIMTVLLLDENKYRC